MTDFFDRHRLGFVHLSRNLFIFVLLLFFLDLFNVIIVSKYVHSNILVVLSFFFGCSWLFFFIKKDEEKYKVILEPHFKFIFILLLVVVAISNLQFQFLLDISLFSLFIKGYIVIQLYLILFAISFGFFTFYFNRDKVEKEAEAEKESEEKAEKKRLKEFDSKFPKLTFFNFSYGVLASWKAKKYLVSILRAIVSPFIWFARLPYSFVKWMYTEGWWYSVGLILIVVLGFLLRINNLSLSSFWVDELTLVYSAKNFLQGQGLTVLSGQLYPHSIISTLILSVSFFFLGISEFSARFPFVLIGVLTILINYFFMKKLFGYKNLAILTSVSLCFSLWLINYSREARFYALSVFLTYCLIYNLFQFIFSYNQKYFNYTLVLTILGSLNHKLFLVFFPFIFLIFLFVNKRYFFNFSTLKKNIFLIWFSIFLVFLILLFFYLFRSTILYFLLNSNVYNYWQKDLYFYVIFLFSNFNIIFWLFFLSVFVTFIDRKIPKLLILFFFFYLLFIFSFLVSAKIGRYILILYPFFLIQALVLLYESFLIIFKKKRLVFLICLLLIALIFVPVYDGYMVSQNKISFNPSLQKNKFSWKEGVIFLKDYIKSNDKSFVVLTSSGMLTEFYGLKSNYTIQRSSSKSFLNDLNETFDYYDNLPYFSNQFDSNLNYVLIFDSNNKKELVFQNLIKSGKFSLIYFTEGIYIYST